MLELVQEYGYLAVFVGAFLEGETVLLIAGFLASGGYLDLAGIVLSGFMGGVAGDQTYFYLGRAQGPPLLERRPSWRPRVAQIERILARHGTLLMLGYRFMYGVRLVAPMVLGAFGVARLRFLAFNLINASVWACVVCGLGYAFGEVATRIFAEVHNYELWVAGGLALAGASGWLFLHLRERRRVARAAATDPTPDP